MNIITDINTTNSTFQAQYPSTDYISDETTTTPKLKHQSTMINLSSDIESTTIISTTSELSTNVTTTLTSNTYESSSAEYSSASYSPINTSTVNVSSTETTPNQTAKSTNSPLESGSTIQLTTSNVVTDSAANTDRTETTPTIIMNETSYETRSINNSTVVNTDTFTTTMPYESSHGTENIETTTEIINITTPEHNYESSHGTENIDTTTIEPTTETSIVVSTVVGTAMYSITTPLPICEDQCKNNGECIEHSTETVQFHCECKKCSCSNIKLNSTCEYGKSCNILYLITLYNC